MKPPDSIEGISRAPESFDAQAEFPKLLALFTRRGTVSFGEQHPDKDPSTRHMVVQDVLLDGQKIGVLRFGPRARVYVGLIPEETIMSRIQKIQKMKNRQQSPPDTVLLGGVAWSSVRLHYEQGSDNVWRRGDGWRGVEFP